MDFFNQIFFGPNIFLTKKTSMKTTITTIEMGFDTSEINLVKNLLVLTNFLCKNGDIRKRMALKNEGL